MDKQLFDKKSIKEIKWLSFVSPQDGGTSMVEHFQDFKKREGRGGGVGAENSSGQRYFSYEALAFRNQLPVSDRHSASVSGGREGGWRKFFFVCVLIYFSSITKTKQTTKQ